MLVFHDISTLQGSKLGCTSAVKHEIHITDSEPFKEQFRCIPPPLLEEVCTSLYDMLDAGAICPSQSPWCNAVVLVRKKDGMYHFCVDFCRLNACTKKDSYPLSWIQEAWQVLHISLQWILKAGSGKLRWHWSLNSIPLSPWAIWGSTSSLVCPLVCVMLLQLSNTSCRTFSGS